MSTRHGRRPASRDTLTAPGLKLQGLKVKPHGDPPQMLQPMNTSFRPTRHTTFTRALVALLLSNVLSPCSRRHPRTTPGRSLGGLVLTLATKSIPVEPTEHFDIEATEIAFNQENSQN